MSAGLTVTRVTEQSESWLQAATLLLLLQLCTRTAAPAALADRNNALKDKKRQQMSFDNITEKERKRRQ
mgnify:CR=1 FL=1